MITSISSEALKNMEWTNRQSELVSKCLVLITKKKRENMQKLQEINETFKKKLLHLLKHDYISLLDHISPIAIWTN